LEDEAYADILKILHNLNKTADASVFDNAVRGDVFPANIAPVIEDCGVAVVKWGFPHWKNSGVLINARAESALEKKMFGNPLRERRCVIPSSGFYEWAHSSGCKLKDKYLLRRPGENVLYMAGMISTFRDAFGNPYCAFVILTTAASDSVSPIHDRIPVILSQDEVDQWTRDDEFMQYVLHRPGPDLSVEMAAKAD